MNGNAFRHLYDYHFFENRKTWDACVTLSQEQFTQEADYSHGSIRDQIVHLMSVDETWFSGLRGVEIPEPLDPARLDDRKMIRAHWDKVEQDMRGYLAGLRDDMLFEKPFADGEDQDLLLWQVLLHVANHGTDHRAQILRLLHDLGVKTTSQDYIFYVYDNVSLPDEYDQSKRKGVKHGRQRRQGQEEGAEAEGSQEGATAKEKEGQADGHCVGGI